MMAKEVQFNDIDMEDYSVLCPICHATIHYSRPSSIEDERRRLNYAWNNKIVANSDQIYCVRCETIFVIEPGPSAMIKTVPTENICSRCGGDLEICWPTTDDWFSIYCTKCGDNLAIISKTQRAIKLYSASIPSTLDGGRNHGAPNPL
jgi:uncharacterized protein YbaR (Trm112 family)